MLEEFNIRTGGLKNEELINLLEMTGNGLKCLRFSEVNCAAGKGVTFRYPRLEKLILKRCQNLTEESVGALLQMPGKELKVLTLSRWGPQDELKGKGLAALDLHFPQLEKLSLDDTGYWCIK